MIEFTFNINTNVNFAFVLQQEQIVNWNKHITILRVSCLLWKFYFSERSRISENWVRRWLKKRWLRSRPMWFLNKATKNFSQKGRRDQPPTDKISLSITVTWKQTITPYGRDAENLILKILIYLIYLNTFESKARFYIYCFLINS